VEQSERNQETSARMHKSDARCVAGQALCVDHAIRPIQPDGTAHYNQLSHEIKSLTPHDDVMDLFERSESRS